MSQDNAKQLGVDLDSLHKQWLKYPITQEITKILFEFKEHHVKNLISKIGDTNTTDAAFRGVAVNVRNTEAIIALVLNTEAFIKAIEKSDKNPNHQVNQ